MFVKRLLNVVKCRHIIFNQFLMTQFLNTEQEREDKLSDIHRQEEELACERHAQNLALITSILPPFQ